MDAELDVLLSAAQTTADAHGHGPDDHGCDGACRQCGHCAEMFVAACPCLGPDGGEDCGCGEISAEEWPGLLESARSVAVRLEQELALLRVSLRRLHEPQMVSSSDPETPDIVCQVCRTDMPCETLAFVDATDPSRTELDEFAECEPPF